MSDQNPLQTQPDRPDPPSKIVAPPANQTFTLVLLGVESPRRNQRLLQRAFGRIRGGVPVRDELAEFTPQALRTGMPHADAVLAQFELICAHAATVLLEDSLFAEADPEYLVELCVDLTYSDEFQPTWIALEVVPDDESGRKFLSQFFGETNVASQVAKVPRKKARAMERWLERIGGRMRFL